VELRKRALETMLVRSILATMTYGTCRSMRQALLDSSILRRKYLDTSCPYEYLSANALQLGLASLLVLDSFRVRRRRSNYTFLHSQSDEFAVFGIESAFYHSPSISDSGRRDDVQQPVGSLEVVRVKVDDVVQ
jgi:hypothetical protein